MKTRPGRWLPDAFRTTYKVLTVAPDGTEMVVVADQKADVDLAAEATGCLPLPLAVPIFVVGELVQELRRREKYEGAWVVTVARRWGFEPEERIGEFPKTEALDRVDALVALIAEGSWQQTH